MKMARLVVWAGLATLAVVSTAQALDQPPVGITVQVEEAHPWRPPFRLERVGRPVTIRIVSKEAPVPGRFRLVERADGHDAARHEVAFPIQPPYEVRSEVDAEATEVVLLIEKDGAPAVEVARATITRQALDADATARPETVVNPVDLGTILVPADRLLLGPGQAGVLEVAALAHNRDVPDAQVRARFASDPKTEIKALPLAKGRRAVASLRLPHPTTTADRDVLQVAIGGKDGATLWSKEIPVMLPREALALPRFGASYTKLRYDPPISVRDPATGAFSSLDYDKGWEPSLRDVVVSLPGGGRFVFWRGSSYIPFWAGRHNTGACYEWAEVITPRPGAVDCVEPLMDKDLRYGRVEIIESSASRVHVRWRYQSTDLHYKVWGDQAVEDYYFYPDGFGTRVVSLKTDPAIEYELCELIVLSPQGAYPFEVLPENLVDALSLDGAKREYKFPIRGEADTPKGGKPPAIYRLRLNRQEEQAAVVFNPGDRSFPSVVFGPFEDRGQLVTPCYWGSHWPLARGNATGSKIDDRIALSPCHNSVMSWAANRPEPISESRRVTIDSLGVSRPVSVRHWAWLIGMTDAGDDRLLQWAHSYAKPPALTFEGAQVAFDGYAIERRATSLRVEKPSIAITIKPEVACVNPVFELIGAPSGDLAVQRDGVALAREAYAWDGRTLWIDATIAGPSRLDLVFGKSPSN
ncbi:hypothetical protein [Paludisphaera borealis]|uniref:Uncharacterized protein n=1 Tax=Paludisphaera borealis TaxID=1387353 RepID=A0A1U7CKH7_9BACT|nr:hypothetical protein [Paludisphaera borealis]APW59383.1 hypothetical protein BSF38_00806 [Paludisphaera borealis]